MLVARRSIFVYSDLSVGLVPKRRAIPVRPSFSLNSFRPSFFSSLFFPAVQINDLSINSQLNVGCRNTSADSYRKPGLGHGLESTSVSRVLTGCPAWTPISL
jgi:hypothetical protein